MKKTLVLFAHPYLESSQSNIELINFYVRHQHYTFRDLYEEFPDFHIPAFREGKRIGNYERFIFHFPLIFFGIPPLLKLWIDEVFDANWQNENHDSPIFGKEAVILITTNANENDLSKGGKYNCTIEELISGLVVVLEQNGIVISDLLCIYEVDHLTKKEIVLHKQRFLEILQKNENG